MGFDFIHLPGGGGELGPIVTGLDLVVSTAECVGGEGFDLLACFRAVTDIFQLAFELFFANIFSGRPAIGKDSATDDIALFLIPSPNPVVRLWGFGIRGLEAKGVPISTSNPALAQLYRNLAAAAKADLRKQFPGDDSVFNAYAYLMTLPNPDSNSAAIAAREAIDGDYTAEVSAHKIDPLTGFRYPSKPPPPPAPPPPKPPPPAHGKMPLPPAEVPSGADETEVYQWYAEQYSYYLANCVCAIEQLVAAAPGPEIWIGLINQSLAPLIQVVSGVAQKVATGPPLVAAAISGINFAPLTAALEELVAAQKRCCEENNLSAANLVAVLERIATAEEKEKAVDLKPLVDAINAFAKIVDVKPAVIDLLVQKGFIDANDAQIIQSADFGDWLVHAIETKGWHALVWLAGELGVDITGPHLKLNAIGNTIAHDVQEFMDVTLDVGAVPLYAVIKGALDAITGVLKPTGAVGPGEAGVDDALLLAKTLGPVLVVNAVAFVLSWIDIGGGEVMAKWIETIAAFTGFEEVREVQVGQDMQAGPVAAARLQAQRTYRQSLPGSGEVTSWVSRGLETDANAKNFLALGGWADSIQPLQLAAAYRGLNPRMMIRLIETGLFADTDIADELTFSGLRPASQHRMLMAAPYLATDPERKQLRATLEKAYVEGFLTDTQLQTQLDDAEHNTARDFLILDRVRLEKRMAIAKDLEAEYSAQYLGNLVSADTYRSNLVGLGLQDDRVNALLARYEARASVTLARQEAAAARAEAKLTAAEERKAAMRNYVQGNLDATGLAAALMLTGLTRAQTAAWVDVAALDQAGRPQHRYGLRLPPEQAQLLASRVLALRDQRKRQFITDIQFRDQLRALKVPDNYINALRAAADATITPAKSALLLPVETS